MKLPVYLGLLNEGEEILARSFRTVAEGHANEPDVHTILDTLARQCDRHVSALHPALERMGTNTEDEEEHRVTADGVREVRSGPLGLLLDLQDLYVLVQHVSIMWTLVGQAAAGSRDAELGGIVSSCAPDTELQSRWIQTRTKQAAPQALLIAR